MADLMETVAGNLQQRIGQIVSQYEAELAVFRAQAQQQLEERDEKIKELEEKLSVPQKETATTTKTKT